MQRAKRHPWWRRLLPVAHVVGLFALFYVYVLLRVRPELFYHQNPVVFLFDGYFFANLAGQPGGLVAYASAFLSAWFAYGWVGALVVTSLGALLCLATHRFFAAVAGAGGRVVFLIPAVLILLILGQYIQPVRACVGLFVALVFANAYVRMGGRPVAARLIAFLVVSGLVYYVAAGPYLVFAWLCGVYELGVKRNYALGVLCVLCAVLVPAAGARLFDLTLSQSYEGLMSSSPQHWLAIPSSEALAVTIQAGLVLFFPVAAAALLGYRRRGGSPVAEADDRTGGQRRAGDARGLRSAISPSRLALTSAAFVACVVALDVVWFDFPKQCLLRMVRSAEHEQYAEVLAHVRRVPASDVRLLDVRTGFHVNRALYHTGDLLDRMFSYPQTLNAPTLALVGETADSMAQTTPRQCSDILFDLGRINESEHMAYEALEVFGDRPRTIKRLIYINVLQNRPEAARRFLALLERSLLHRRWARRCARQLDADPKLSGVSAVASRRDFMVVRDATGEIVDLEGMLGGLLERNPRNRMAFEYLMAHYLLTRQLEPLVANLHRFDDFDDPRWPRHCEEALVIHLAATRSQDLDLGVHRIRPETWRRYREFVQALQPFPRERAAEAFAALHDDFGDSYFFFHVFGSNNPPSGLSP